MSPRDELRDVEAMLDGMIALQVKKVLALARRLRPGVTPEDIRNPHDFAELDDADYHYEDGMLNGLQAALSALRARMRELSPALPEG